MFFQTHRHLKNKLQQKSKPCVFIGYSLNHQGYKCLDLSTRRVYLSRHVLFDEDFFPFKGLTSSSESVDALGNNHLSQLLFTFPSPSTSSMPVLSSPSQTNLHILQISPATISAPCSDSNPEATTVPYIDPSIVNSPTSLSHVDPSLPLGHSLPSNEQVLVDSQPVHIDEPRGTGHSMTTRFKSGVIKPNPKYAMHVAFDSVSVEPTCYSQAVKHEEWRHAMVQEFNALQWCGTWNLVPYHPKMNVRPNKWVFKIKRRADGTIERHKARLVANGFHQKAGLDYNETFSPVVNDSTSFESCRVKEVACAPT